jgi:hydroxyethylthiazole kinase-like uncharacterized protein yjeF
MSALILETAEIRRAEALAGAATPALMERAGLAAAAQAARLASAGKDVLVLAGPGNNGGDAFEVAALLRQQFFRVTLVSLADPAKLPADAARAHRKWLEAGGETATEIPHGRKWSLIVDGLFGIGLSRPADAGYASLIEYANSQGCPLLALDVPSGLSSDTGQRRGATVRATHTLTFIALKPGLLTLDGPDCSGEVGVADLGLDLSAFAASAGRLASVDLFSAALHARPDNFHKGNAGSLAVFGGASGMTGAALLAGRAALKLGAGRVYLGLLAANAPTVDALAPELMLRHPDEALGQELDTIVIGPGLGRSERASSLVGAALATDLPCVLDADALNLLAEDEALREACLRRRSATQLTPHPGEAARLLACSTAEVQSDRLSAARAIAARFAAQVVLKGNGSILVGSGSRWYLNRSGNPGMASAGMGDTLAGMLGALLAQRIDPEAALVLAVHLHGASADALAASGNGPIGIVAGELPDAARRIWNRWTARR